VAANGEKLGRLVSSLVSFTNTALIGWTVIEVKPNTHRMFGTTFTAKYVDFILRHDETTSFSPLYTFKASIIRTNLFLVPNRWEEPGVRCTGTGFIYGKSLDWAETADALARLAWCPEPDSNRHGPFGPRDFKSRVSTKFHHPGVKKPIAQKILPSRSETSNEKVSNQPLTRKAAPARA
jgi:hypothetical protein